MGAVLSDPNICFASLAYRQSQLKLDRRIGGGVGIHLDSIVLTWTHLVPQGLFGFHSDSVGLIWLYLVSLDLT